jgi:hypothetical protein
LPEDDQEKRHPGQRGSTSQIRGSSAIAPARAGLPQARGQPGEYPCWTPAGSGAPRLQRPGGREWSNDQASVTGRAATVSAMGGREGEPMRGEPGFGTPEAEAWDMLERVNLFLIQFRSDLAKGVPVEHELFLGTIRNWHRLSREVEEMLRDRGLLETE